MSENKPVIKVDDLGLQFGDISGLKNLLRELQKHVEDMDGWALICYVNYRNMLKIWMDGL